MSVRWTILSTVIGAILGGAITAGALLYSSTKAQQGNTARELLSEVIALVSLKEGWLLQGEGTVGPTRGAGGGAEPSSSPITDRMAIKTISP